MKELRKVIISGMIGNTLEWYDYALYGHFAAIISTLFFPSENKYVSLMATFGVFAAGFIMRPVGAMFFGYIGDRFGRRQALAISILMMAIPTACIGLLPTYAQVGILAPLLLTLIRLLQGLSLGGEFSGSITFLVEYADDKHRGIVGATSLIGMLLGILLGSGVATFLADNMSKEAFEEWGWRAPFVAGMAIGLVGMYIRSHLHESPAYLQAKAEGQLSKTPIKEVFQHHMKPVCLAIGMYLTVTVPFYVLVVFMNTFMSKVLGHSVEEALTINTINMFILLALVPLSAWLSDRYGRKRVLSLSAFGFLLLSYPIFLLLVQPGFYPALVGQMALAVLVGFYIAPIPAVLVEMFPTSVRYTGMAFSYNFCAAIFGGTAPMVSTWLLKATGMNTIVAFYVMLCAAVTLFCLYHYKDRWREPLVG